MGTWPMACLDPCSSLMLFLVPSKGLAAAQVLLCVSTSGLDPCLALLCSHGDAGGSGVLLNRESLAFLCPSSRGSPGASLSCCPDRLSDGCPCLPPGLPLPPQRQ